MIYIKKICMYFFNVQNYVKYNYSFRETLLIENILIKRCLV